MTPCGANPATRVELQWVGNRQSESDEQCDDLKDLIGVYETIPGWKVHDDQVLRGVNQIEPAFCFKSSDTGKWIFNDEPTGMDENLGILRFNSLSTGTPAEAWNDPSGWRATSLVRIIALHRTSGGAT